MGDGLRTGLPVCFQSEFRVGSAVSFAVFPLGLEDPLPVLRGFRGQSYLLPCCFVSYASSA